MEGAPADMGDWGITRVFHEAGRLLRKHLRDLLPTILLCVFPATLIKVLHAQYFRAAFGGPPGFSYFPQSTFWLVLPLGLFFALPAILIPIAFVTMAQVLKDSIYPTDLTAECYSQPLCTSVKLATRISWGVDETGGSSHERFREASKGKKLKVISAMCMGFMLYVITSSGMYFTPEAVAAMGLPPWTIFLFTLLILTVKTVIASYFLLVGIVIWTYLDVVSKGAHLDVK